MTNHVHLAGIIPIANSDIDFAINVPVCMLPINESMAVVQKSIVECAVAGCQTIWIVANDDMSPIIRKTIGDWVYDPVYYNRKHKYPSEVRKEIPIYYVPVLPKNRDRRDSYGWSVLSGIHSAWFVANKLSKWVVPEKYYISFPYGMYDIYQLRKHRQEISSLNYNFFLSHEGKSVKDNLQLPFTMMAEDFKRCRQYVNAETTKTYYNTDEKYPSKKLPLSERWSARNFDFETVFKEVNETSAVKLSTGWFFQLDSWENYVSYVSNKNRVETPKEPLTKAHKHVKLTTMEDNCEK